MKEFSKVIATKGRLRREGGDVKARSIGRRRNIQLQRASKRGSKLAIYSELGGETATSSVHVQCVSRFSLPLSSSQSVGRLQLWRSLAHPSASSTMCAARSTWPFLWEELIESNDSK